MWLFFRCSESLPQNKSELEYHDRQTEILHGLDHDANTLINGKSPSSTKNENITNNMQDSIKYVDYIVLLPMPEEDEFSFDVDDIMSQQCGFPSSQYSDNDKALVQKNNTLNI